MDARTLWFAKRAPRTVQRKKATWTIKQFWSKTRKSRGNDPRYSMAKGHAPAVADYTALEPKNEIKPDAATEGSASDTRVNS